MTNEIKIQKGLEMPHRNRVHLRKYPFGDMEVGDSFVINASDATELEALSVRVVEAIARAINKGNNPKRFATRHLPGTLSIGVWRTE